MSQTFIDAPTHGFVAGDQIVFSNLEGGQGIVEGALYYVIAGGLTADIFQFSETLGGAAFAFDTPIVSGNVAAWPTYSVESGIMSPPDTPSAPTDLTLTTFVTTDADGHQHSVVAADLVHDTTDGVSGAVVEATWTDAGGSTPDWTKKAVINLPVGTLRASFTVPGNLTVWVRAYAVTVYGATSAYTGVSSTASAKDTSAPATPAGLTVVGGILGIVAKWNQNTEGDLSYYEFVYSTASDFSVSPVTKQFKGNLAVIGGLAAGTWYVKVRAVDTSGNASAYTAGSSADSRLTGTSDLDPSAVINQATNLINGTATVTVDDDGIHILDGALFLEDEFGSTVLAASGFAGSWSDFVALGVYNSRFLSGVAGVIPNGRTAALPYWTASDVAGSPVLTFLNPGTKVTFAALSNKKRLVSDVVPNVPGQALNYGVLFDVARSSGTMVVSVYFQGSNDPTFATGVSGSLVETDSRSISATDVVVQAFDSSLGLYKYARLVIEVEETVAHSASNSVTLRAAWLRDSPSEIGNAVIGNTLQVDEAADPPVSVIGNFVAYGTAYSDEVVLDTANIDVRLRRTGTKQLTFDDNVGGALGGGFVIQGQTPLRFGSIAFPSTPSTDDLFYRTDYGMWFRYDGTRWVCACPHTLVFSQRTGTNPFSATQTLAYGAPLPVARGLDILIENYDCAFTVASGGTALGASHKWVIDIATRPSGTFVSALSIASGASATFRSVTDTGDDVVDCTSADTEITANVTKTGTPGNLTAILSVEFRYIAT